MRCHGFAAITNSFANHKGADQTSHSSVDVNNGTASEVKRAPLPDHAGFAVHLVNNFFGCVGVRAHPEPNHVSDWQVAESEPQSHEDQDCGKLDALCKCTDDQGTRDASKRGLETCKGNFRNDHAFAESRGIGEGARCVVPNTIHEQTIESTNVGVTFGECQAVTVDEPQDRDQGEGHHHLHQHRQHVLAANQAAVEQGQARHHHHDDQDG